MRKSREEAAQTRRRIVEAASREFRKNGIVATGLNDLMKAAGLTHGVPVYRCLGLQPAFPGTKSCRAGSGSFSCCFPRHISRYLGKRPNCRVMNF
jgi:hypothetical protein